VLSRPALRERDPQAAGNFETDVLAAEGVSVVVAAGEIDLATSEPFEASLARAVDCDRPVVVDLCDVSFIGSTGLRAVLQARAKLDGAGRPLALACRPDGVVARVVALVVATRPLVAHPSREAAVRTVCSA
jgi:anti-sigma B factor antagonist